MSLNQESLDKILPQLSKVRLIVFDWDGTAVMGREAPHWPLIAVLEQVLRCRILCAVITGTKLENLTQPILQYLSPHSKTQLYVCANRGSEVFGFDSLGRDTLLDCYRSSEEENAKLDALSTDLREHWAHLGIQTQIIRNRLNRRKLDLIPEDQRWSDPRKDELMELWRVIKDRLQKSQLTQGLPQLLEMARESALQYGLKNPQITTDLKHIEVGLTSKQDSMRWIWENLILRNQISETEVLVVGDEFGDWGGVPGSDSLMRIPELAHALFVSVGVEPEGVPQGVEFLGGGPHQFVSLLQEVKRLKQKETEERNLISRDERSELLTWGWSMKDPHWRVQQDAFDASQETEFEALFTLGNGRLGIRGSLCIPIPASRGDLFLAGVFDGRAKRALSMYPSPGLREDLDEFSERVIFPSLFYLRLKINGELFVPGRWEKGHEYKRYLSLDTGILSEVYEIEVDSQGAKLRVHTQRLVAAHHSSLLIQEVQFMALQRELSLEVDTSLEDPDHELKHPHLKILSMEIGGRDFTELHEFETLQSSIRSVFLAQSYFQGEAMSKPLLSFSLLPSQAYVLQKLVLVYDSRDTTLPRQEALEKMKGLHVERLPSEILQHCEIWRRFWGGADTSFPRQLSWERSLRFNAYHLRIAADEDPRSSIGARTLSGSAYDGHVFWDTEIFILPFFNHHVPSVVKSCLTYRYSSLPQARLRASEMGCQGACFAWESTVTGKDVTPTHILLSAQNQRIPVFTGPQQIHITADVAHAVWKYWWCTQDLEWMIRFGAELFIETARFWVSRSQKIDQTYHILKVVGPDEYHHDVDDNAYTNWMARENLNKAVWMCEYLAEKAQQEWMKLAGRLRVSPLELKSWKEVERALYFPEPNDQGVIEEFRGFFKLPPLPQEKEDSFTAPLERLLFWEKVNRSQIVKQADVLMIPFLFQESFSSEMLSANYHFYKPLTDHGSSLSLAVYAGIAARIQEWGDCQNYWQHSLNLDLSNLMKNTSLGIHAGCLGGTWQALIFHILGVRLQEDRLGIFQAEERSIPDPWRGLKTRLRYQDQVYELEVSQGGQVSLCLIKKTKGSC